MIVCINAMVKSGNGGWKGRSLQQSKLMHGSEPFLIHACLCGNDSRTTTNISLKWFKGFRSNRKQFEHHVSVGMKRTMLDIVPMDDNIVVSVIATLLVPEAQWMENLVLRRPLSLTAMTKGDNLVTTMTAYRGMAADISIQIQLYRVRFPLILICKVWMMLL